MALTCRDDVCIVVLAAVPFGYIQQAQQVIASRMAEEGCRVIFVEPLASRFPEFRDVARFLMRCLTLARTSLWMPVKAAENLRVIRLVGVPEKGLMFRWINRVLFLSRNVNAIQRHLIPGNKVVVECWKPLEIYLHITQSLQPNRLVYSCIDNYQAQYKAAAHLSECEREFVRYAGDVIVISEVLAQKVSELRSGVLIRDAAVDFSLFFKADRGPVSDVRKLCFFGAVSERLDFELINGLARVGYQISLIGPVKRLPAFALSNLVKFIRPVPVADLPAILAGMDVIILPYVINRYTEAIRLAKIFECFATGKPIVATPLPSLKKFSDLIDIVHNLDECLIALKGLVESEQSGERKRSRQEIARKNSWDLRVEEEYALLMKGL